MTLLNQPLQVIRKWSVRWSKTLAVTAVIPGPPPFGDRDHCDWSGLVNRTTTNSSRTYPIRKAIR